MNKIIFSTALLIILTLSGCNSTYQVITPVTDAQISNLGYSKTGGGSDSTGLPLYFTCGENAGLDNNNQEWSCGGNGETGQEVIIFENLTLTNVGLDCNVNNGDTVINIRKNLANSGCQGTFTNQYDTITCNENFTNGDTFQPFTISDTGHSQCVITMRFITR